MVRWERTMWLAGWVSVLSVELVFITTGAEGLLASPAKAMYVLWFVLPLVFILRRGLRGLDLGRNRLLWCLLVGMLVGAVWRAASVLLAVGLEILLGAELFLLLFGLVILTPIVEEFLFRGLLLGKAPGGAFWFWNCLQALVFTFEPPHMGYGWPVKAGVFLFGLMAGWIYHRTGSLWSAIAAHGMANLLTVILNYA